MEKPLSLSKELKDFNDFVNACNHFGIEINNNQLSLFKRYYEILLDWNTRINLVSRGVARYASTGNDPIIEKHFLDSIVFLPEIEGLINQTPTILDIGSGGGFPGIPLAIIKPEWTFTLCESTTKKANFLSHLVKELDLKNTKIINSRVEALRATPLRTIKYYLITARAVDKLDVLIKYALPLLKKDGYLIAYKAKNIDEEIKHAQRIFKKNKMQLKIFSKEINNIERKLVVLKAEYFN